ncbi:MAG: response regulator [Rhodothermales bacterium]
MDYAGDAAIYAASGPPSSFDAPLETPDESSNGPIPHRRRSLLIVEDNLSTRTLLAYLLKTHYEVMLVAGVDEALTLVQERSFDGLVLDINLCEERTGVDLLHAIRALPTYKAVPAIACTAYTRWGDRENLLEEGFDGYVGKPFTKTQLFEALDQIFTPPLPDMGLHYEA